MDEIVDAGVLSDTSLIENADCRPGTDAEEGVFALFCLVIE